LREEFISYFAWSSQTNPYGRDRPKMRNPNTQKKEKERGNADLNFIMWGLDDSFIIIKEFRQWGLKL